VNKAYSDNVEIYKKLESTGGDTIAVKDDLINERYNQWTMYLND